MATTSPIPVRLEEALIDRLDQVAERIGSNRAAVIRFCIQTFVEHFERNGRATLPPNWEEIIAQMDNRTRESKVRSKTNFAVSPNETIEQVEKVVADKVRKRKA